MEQTTAETVDTLLREERGSTWVTVDQLPTAPEEVTILETQATPPKECPIKFCSEQCTTTRVGDQFRIVCEADDPHEITKPVTEYSRYRLDFEATLERVFQTLNLDLKTFETHLPDYVVGVTPNDVAVYLLVHPFELAQSLTELTRKVVTAEQPSVFLTPTKTIKRFLDNEVFRGGGEFVYPAPITAVDESPELIREAIAAMQSVTELEASVGDEWGVGSTHDVVAQSDRDSRRLLVELNAMKLLRVNGELPDGDGTRLEKVAERVFAHLFMTYPEAGGEDNTFENVPDNLFYITDIDDTAAGANYDTVLGIVDTKSGADASFGSEPTKGKHEQYLKLGRRTKLPSDYRAHVFVVQGFDGHQEIAFYDEFSTNYTDEEYLVVVTVDALMIMLAAYLNASVNNDLSLVAGDFRKVLYPFFHQPLFTEFNLDKITRKAGNQSEYDDKYDRRPKLLVVTREVVKTRFEQLIDGSGTYEEILESYFSNIPNI